MGRLVDRELGTLNERLETKQLSVDIGPSLRVHLTNQGFDQRYGARPLKSLFAKKVTRPLSHRLMQDDDMTGTWTLDLDDSGHLLMNAIEPGPLN